MTNWLSEVWLNKLLTILQWISSNPVIILYLPQHNMPFLCYISEGTDFPHLFGTRHEGLVWLRTSKLADIWVLDQTFSVAIIQRIFILKRYFSVISDRGVSNVNNNCVLVSRLLRCTLCFIPVIMLLFKCCRVLLEDSHHHWPSNTLQHILRSVMPLYM